MKIDTLNFTELWNTNGTINVEKRVNGYRVTKYFGKYRDYSYSMIIREQKTVEELNKSIAKSIKEINTHNKDFGGLAHGCNYVIS